ncbi:replication endonuclease [Vibrio parahaemolyticus]|nr:replication endonuclease [Vibrio parahaemolyticus]EKL0190341.1 replication endonuclease [Vibrio parahaemolyticus]EME0149544.1 replication endonuclease [Vibrio parahaemolyticus]EME0863099.1 replication endonuclease [Vibrio parahaemolyticus]
MNAQKESVDSYTLSLSLVRHYFNLPFEKVKGEAKRLSEEFKTLSHLNEENYSKIIVHRAFRDFFFFDNETLISVNNSILKKQEELASMDEDDSTFKIISSEISELESKKVRLYERAFLRLKSYTYCSRKLARLVLLEMLYSAQEKKEIGGTSGKSYATDLMKNYRKMQNAYNSEFLASKKIDVNGKSISLLEISCSIQKRISELYAKTKGLENRATEMGYGWAFLTMTASAHLHSNPTKGRSSWNKSNANAAKEELQNSWSAFGKEISNLGYPMKEGHIFGMRVVEPHQDGTPHWHMIVFYDLDLEERLFSDSGLFQKHFNRGSQHSLKIVIGEIDKSGNLENVASAATYCFKYITKAIGGDFINEHGIRSYDDNLNASNANATVDAIEAWRAATGSRAYQMFGINGYSSYWNYTRKIAHRTGRLEAYEIDGKKKYEIIDSFVDFDRLEEELNSLPTQKENEELTNSYLDSLSDEELAYYDSKTNLIDTDVISLKEQIRLEKKHSPLSEHHSIDEKYKLIEMHPAGLDIFQMYSVHSDLISIMKQSVSGNFSNFITECEKRKIHLIKEEYKNKYGEDCTRVIGIYAGIQVYLFKKYLVKDNNEPLRDDPSRSENISL